jgi:hypothetical protein
MKYCENARKSQPTVNNVPSKSTFRKHYKASKSAGQVLSSHTAFVFKRRSCHLNPSLSNSSMRCSVMLQGCPSFLSLYCLRWHLIHVLSCTCSGLFEGTFVCPCCCLNSLSSCKRSPQAALCESQQNPTPSRVWTRSNVIVELIPSIISLYWYLWNRGNPLCESPATFLSVWSRVQKSSPRFQHTFVF